MYGKSVLFSRVVCSDIRFHSSSSGNKKLLEILAKMPKANSPRIAEAQRQRQVISKKGDKYGPSTVYLQVLGSGARGAPNTLYLFTDQKRYLFNCGECTQRLAHEHKVKLSRLEHIFITGKTWRCIGGLPGLSLTLQDVGVPKIVLHGPEGLDELYAATRRFIIMKDMQVSMAKCGPNDDYEDSVMSVKYVVLGANENILTTEIQSPTKKQKTPIDVHEKELEKFSRDMTDYYQSEQRSDRRTAKAPKGNLDQGKKRTEKVLQELQKKSHCTLAYICTLKKRLGTLNLEKCVELGVKPGPLLGQLKNGQDVVLPDGTFVLSKDVKTPDDPGPVFIVLDVPDLSYLKESEFSAHFDDGTNPPERIPTIIIHFTPSHVFHHPGYQQFLNRFGKTTRHLLLNEQNSCLGSEAVHRTQHKLHLLDPDIFPLLKDISVPAVWNAQTTLPKTNSPIRLKGLEELKNKIALAQFQNIINMEGSCKGDFNRPTAENDEEDKLEIIAGRTLTMFHLRPKKQLDRSAEPKLHIQDYIKETMDVDGFVNSLEQFRRLVDSIRYANSKTQEEYPKIVFLGTGSCIPSKTRNTSAIVLQVDENRSMLLDCGEGTFMQLVRFYGPKRINTFLRSLKAIYISHLHADHHIGLIGVLQARREAFQETNQQACPDPVYLLAPGQIITWLSLYDQTFERIRSDFSLIPNQTLLVDNPNPHSSSQFADLTSALLAGLGLDAIQTTQVTHCPNAFGVALTIGENKITYSGDTLPCAELVKLGMNSTLLIHEATMEDELADEARAKMHSTTTQAIEMGRQMLAQYTVLTHFSQRYARLPRLNANILNDNNSVGIAFDNMQITMSDLQLLPHMYAPLQLMFAEHCVEMELKAAHRARHKQRRPSSTELDADAESKLRALKPFRCAAYKDSIASRLRLEARSKSKSPSKIPIRPGAYRTSSGRSTPRARSMSRDERVIDYLDILAPPRTLSETSYITKDMDRLRCSTNELGLVDSRSKTLNAVYHYNGNAQDLAHRRPPYKLSANASKSNSLNLNSLNNETGYGSPLVLPMHKRLTLRREGSKLGSNVISLSNTIGHIKSPNLLKPRAENRLASPTLFNRFRALQGTNIFAPEVTISVITHLVFWRIVTVVSGSWPFSWVFVTSVIAVSVLFWTASQSPEAVNRRPWNYSTSMKHDTSKEFVGSVGRCSSNRDKRPPSSPVRSRYHSPTRKSNSFDKNPHLASNEVKNRALYTRVKSANASFDCQRLKISVNMSEDKEGSSLSINQNKKEAINQRNPLHKKDFTLATRQPLKRENSGLKAIKKEPSIASKKESVSSTKRMEHLKSDKPSGIRPPQIRSKLGNRNEPRSNSSSDNSPERSSSKTKADTQRNPSNGDIPKAKQTLREAVNDSIKKNNAFKPPASKDISPIPVIGKPGSAVRSNKSFKPQLEDIKSSILLLNKKNFQPDPAIPKPKPVDENERKKKLEEAKEKFRSKHFRNEAKYDKIEGLNWISWK